MKICNICARKHKVNEAHHHTHKISNSVLPPGNIKGAPYYPAGGSKASKGGRNIGERSNSNGRAKSYNKVMKPPKWLKKDYQPVFQMQPPQGTIETAQSYVNSEILQ